MQIDYRLLGRRVAEFRRRRKLTQAQLAEKAGVTTQFISQIETAKYRPGLQTLVDLAMALEVSIDDLLIGNQYEDEVAVEKAIQEMMDDCSRYERTVLYESLAALKKILRDNTVRQELN